jgi:hypothetical protein
VLRGRCELVVVGALAQVLAFAHQEVDDGIWVVTFVTYDLGSIDLEQKTLQPIDNPFGTRVSPMS